jgi:large subunit ribosomal protein L3
VVVQRKSKQKDGYSAVQLGLVEPRKVKGVTKAMRGHFDKAGLPPCKVLRELRVEDGDQVAVGDKVSVEVFSPGDLIDVVGVSKGKGFQGVVKRHHFRGGDATHGSMFHRAPGGIGASAYPSRVLKGMRAAGHMGSDRVTARNLTVVRVDAENNLLIVKGAIPGAGGGYVVIRKGKRAAGAAPAKG